MPVLLQTLPTGQARHAVAPTAATNVPAKHAEGDDWATALTMKPGSAQVQDNEPDEAENAPAGQGKATDKPERLLK